MFNEDLSLFFDVDDFAIEVTIDNQLVTGIFGDEPVEVNFVQMMATTFTYRAADKVACVNDLLVNGSDVYRVKSMIADGTGLMKLILEKQ